MGEVLVVKHENGLGELILNRPKALNSLNTDMLLIIQKALEEWKTDDSVQAVLLRSDLERALCAGGDIKMLHAAQESEENRQAAMNFFDIEYDVDLMIAEYDKPIIAYLNGIVMGGGVGLTQGASHRIVTETTRWAMPEMNIGFFPDVGGSYFLNRAPGQVGRYLALSASTIGAQDAIYAKVADEYVLSENLSALTEDLKRADFSNGSAKEVVEQAIAKVRATFDGEGKLEQQRAAIDEHFAKETVEDIIASLESADDEFSQKTASIVKGKSPVSLKVTLEQLKRGEGKSLKDCLAMELNIGSNFLKHKDFYEGIRSVVIDKDQNPQYEYKNLEDVSEAFVDSFFTA